MGPRTRKGSPSRAVPVFETGARGESVNYRLVTTRVNGASDFYFFFLRAVVFCARYGVICCSSESPCSRNSGDEAVRAEDTRAAAARCEVYREYIYKGIAVGKTRWSWRGDEVAESWKMEGVV